MPTFPEVFEDEISEIYSVVFIPQHLFTVGYLKTTISSRSAQQEEKGPHQL